MDLYKLLEESAAIFDVEALRKGIEFSLEVDEDVPQWVLGDETRLRQILNNLLSNAVKFTNRGSVRMRVNCENAWQVGETCEIEFEVADTGIGISEEQANRLFNPFSQADSSTTRQYGGTGLGLVICKRLSEAMGGRVLLNSKSGEGSQFYAYIPVEVIEGENADTLRVLEDPMPIQPTTSSMRSELSSAEDDSGNLKIAVAEDNLSIRGCLKLCFSRLVFRMSTLF